MKGIDLRKVITKEHEDKWVALSTDYKKVISYSKDIKKLRDSVGKKEVVYMKVPISGRNYAFPQN